jgi:GPH family glycoside/pentoside/hexuronide:cation symporter
MSSSSSVGGRLSTSLKWLFGAGDLTTSAPLAIVSFFQLFFLTDVARLSPALAAWPIVLGKLWDAVNDPVVGFLADRLRSPYGRRRVLLAAAAGPVGFSFVLMWLVPPFGTMGLLVYYTVIYIVFDTAYTVVHIAYNSLTPELTTDYDEQSSLHGVRMVYSIAGSLLAIIIGTVLQWIVDDPVVVFLVLGIVLGVVIVVPPLIVVRITRGRDAPSGGVQPPPWDGFKQLLGNRPFWLVMGVYLTSWTAVSIIAADLVYFARYNLAVPSQANYFVLVAQGLALAFIPLTVAIARKWEKRVAVIVGFGTMVPVLIAIGSVPAGGYRVVYLLAALLGMGIATAYVTPWSMIPDVIQWDAHTSGARREGSYYSIVAFFQKTGTAAALWLMAQALEASGYVTPTDSEPIPAQPESALSAIRLFISVVPSVLFLGAIAFAIAYPISRSVSASLGTERT